MINQPMIQSYVGNGNFVLLLKALAIHCGSQNYQAELSLVKIFAEGQHFSRIIIRQNTGKLKECKIIWSQFMANVWPIYSQTHLKGFHGKLWSEKQTIWHNKAKAFWNKPSYLKHLRYPWVEDYVGNSIKSSLQTFVSRAESSGAN